MLAGTACSHPVPYLGLVPQLLIGAINGHRLRQLAGVHSVVDRRAAGLEQLHQVVDVEVPRLMLLLHDLTRPRVGVVDKPAQVLSRHHDNRLRGVTRM